MDIYNLVQRGNGKGGIQASINPFRSVCVAFNGRQVQCFEYDRTFDQRYIIHVMGILLSVVKFGGQGFTKIAKATPITRSSHAAVCFIKLVGSSSS